MKRFRFSLRPVAIMRAHREQRAREQFAAAVHAFVAAEEELQRTRTRMQALESALFNGRQNGFRAAEAASLLADYRHECAGEVEAERTSIAAREEMERRRTAYLEAHRNLEVVERLEEKARGVHYREMLRHEQAEFDEFAGHRRLKPASLSV